MITPITQYADSSIRGLCYHQLYLVINDIVSSDIIDKLMPLYSMYIEDQNSIEYVYKQIAKDYFEIKILELSGNDERIGFDSDL